MIRKALRVAGAVLAGLAVLFLAAIAISPYFRRWALLNGPDVYDYDKLPTRTVSRSAQPFRFPDSTSGDWVAPLKLAYARQPIGDETALGRFLADHGSTAFIAVKDGRLLDERYFNGFRRESLFKSFSVTKSVLSALIGAAMADGFIGSVDDPVTKYIPEMKDPRFARVTLRNLLDNTAGIRYARGNMPWVTQPRMYYTTDVRGYVRGAEIDVDPGVRFSTEDLSPIILGWVLERALRRHPSNPTLSNYLAERIWQPMGAEYDASMDRGSRAGRVGEGRERSHGAGDRPRQVRRTLPPARALELTPVDPVAVGVRIHVRGLRSARTQCLGQRLLQTSMVGPQDARAGAVRLLR